MIIFLIGLRGWQCQMPYVNLHRKLLLLFLSTNQQIPLFYVIYKPMNKDISYYPMRLLFKLYMNQWTRASFTIPMKQSTKTFFYVIYKPMNKDVFYYSYEAINKDFSFMLYKNQWTRMSFTFPMNQSTKTCPAFPMIYSVMPFLRGSGDIFIYSLY